MKTKDPAHVPLSLCIIAGNVEKHIGRFLDHFEPLADEICVVRAIGNQDPDGTLDIAERRGCTTGEYRNQESHRYWPHVDDFAAARNQAFQMASHGWVMWADTDDVIDAESIGWIRKALASVNQRKEVSGLLMRYNVPDDGLVVFRERIIRKGAGQWVNPIHECLAMHDPEAQLARIDEGQILHASGGRPGTSDERNLRILESIPQDKRNTSQRFHLFQSMRAVGREQDAANEAIAILKNPPADMEAPEKYELYIALGQMTKTPSDRASLFLQAMATDPTRREAYGELALCELSCGNPKQSLGWSRAMTSQPLPRDPIWNLRPKYYQYLGVQIKAASMRANGDHAGADALELNHFKKSGGKISLIHATRGRPAKAAQAQREWLTSAAFPDQIEHIFCVDLDDELSSPLSVFRHVAAEPGGGCVRAWNAGAEVCNGDVIIQLSDDWKPPLHWDALILNAIGDTSKPAVLQVSDGSRKDDLLCMAILTRARLKEQGYFFHPAFKSMYSDNWFSECAHEDGVVIDARHLVFQHMHPAFGLGEMDQTYAESNAPERYEEGMKILNRLRDERHNKA